jgi:hypothetical protein
MNHEIDILNFVLGHSGFESRKIHDGYDAYHVVGTRDDSITFEFRGTRRLESRKYIETLTMRFDRGQVEASDGYIIIDNHDGEIREVRVDPTDYALRGRMVTDNFIKCIDGKEKCYLTTEDLYVNNAVCVMLTEQDQWRYTVK